MTTAILPFQLPLRQRLPLVQGNVDYQQVRQLLQRMEEIILLGGLELLVGDVPGTYYPPNFDSEGGYWEGLNYMDGVRRMQPCQTIYTL